MSLALLNTVILRTLANPDYTVKGSELTWEELDTNIKIIANAIKEVSQQEVPGVEPYDSGEEYSNTGPSYVTYDGNTYEYINITPQTGVTPGTDATVWKLVSSGLFSHKQNTDTKLAEGTSDEVTATELRAIADAGPFDDSTLVKLDGSRVQELIKIANAGLIINADGTVSIQVGTGSGGNVIKLTGSLQLPAGSSANGYKSIAFGGEGTGVYRDTGYDGLKWIINAVNSLWLYAGGAEVKGNLSVDGTATIAGLAVATENYGSSTGTDTYTSSFPLSAYVEGKKIYIKFTNANTGASTIDVNSLGPIAIVKNGSTPLSAGDINAGQIFCLIYDGTNIQII